MGKVFLFSPGDGSFHRMSGDMGGGGGPGEEEEEEEEMLQEHKIGGISKHKCETGSTSNLKLIGGGGVEMVSLD